MFANLLARARALATMPEHMWAALGGALLTQFGISMLRQAHERAAEVATAARLEATQARWAAAGAITRAREAGVTFGGPDDEEGRLILARAGTADPETPGPAPDPDPAPEPAQDPAPDPATADG